MIRPSLLVCSLGVVLLGLSLAQDAKTPELGPLPEAREVNSDVFATSQSCALCHSSSPQAKSLRDAKGRVVAPFDLWESSMMANSTRDPLWRAVVSAEVAATPSRKKEIEAKCMRCHAPMASTEARFKKESVGLDLVRKQSDRAQLALDGVSCTVCHQIQPKNLGKPESYSGHYEIKKDRDIFGPHKDPIGMPMMRHTGFTPKHGKHLRRSALCATCHTLHTDALAPDGSKTGHTLPEQTPYLEWRNSVFNDELKRPGKQAASCQACHVPTTDVDGKPIMTPIARAPHGGDFRLGGRAPFGRHVFVGGNTLVPAILRDHRQELGAQAPKAAFDATIALAKQQLQRKTATVSLGKIARVGDLLKIPVQITQRVGHKLPSGHPSRRVWLRVRVRDAAGKVLFTSGEHDKAGRLLDGQGKVLATDRAGGGVQPHHQVIKAAAQVQIYEATMADAKGKPTYLLTRGAWFLKDNRLLPRGWRSDHPDIKHIAPRGTKGDGDFKGGGDTVRYEVSVKGAQGPFKVEATLLYQVLGARYAAELFLFTTPQVRAFRRYYEKADRTPVAISKAEQ